MMGKVEAVEAVVNIMSQAHIAQAEDDKYIYFTKEENDIITTYFNYDDIYYVTISSSNGNIQVVREVIESDEVVANIGNTNSVAVLQIDMNTGERLNTYINIDSMSRIGKHVIFNDMRTVDWLNKINAMGKLDQVVRKIGQYIINEDEGALSEYMSYIGFEYQWVASVSSLILWLPIVLT
jgi:hypothetical protein